jgi:hypothetical protein
MSLEYFQKDPFISNIVDTFSLFVIINLNAVFENIRFNPKGLFSLSGTQK